MISWSCLMWADTPRTPVTSFSVTMSTADTLQSRCVCVCACALLHALIVFTAIVCARFTCLHVMIVAWMKIIIYVIQFDCCQTNRSYRAISILIGAYSHKYVYVCVVCAVPVGAEAELSFVIVLTSREPRVPPPDWIFHFLHWVYVCVCVRAHFSCPLSSHLIEYFTGFICWCAILNWAHKTCLYLSRTWTDLSWIDNMSTRSAHLIDWLLVYLALISSHTLPHSHTRT